MKTLLTLERLDRNGRLLEKREQASRSFLHQFIQALYVAHTQPVSGAPYAGTVGLDRHITNADITVSAVGATSRMTSLLQVSAPSGLASLLAEVYGTNAPHYDAGGRVQGHSIGIQVGLAATPATPTDYRLGQRVGHGRRAPDGAALVFEEYNVNDDTNRNVWGANWAAQLFTPSVSHRLTSVLVKIFKTGAPGDLTVSIHGYNVENNNPGSTALTTGTILEAAIPGASPGAQTECVFATPVDVYAGHRYCIIISAPASGAVGNRVDWRYDAAGATYQRATVIAQSAASANMTSGGISTSANSGVTWSAFGSAGVTQLFQEKGQSVGEFMYGGCELDNYVVANPNASFDIRRYFTNLCGSTLAVQEIGLASLVRRVIGTNSVAVHPILIARDVVAAVNVLNTEVLRVTYTPSITV